MASGTKLYLLALAAGGGGMLTFGWDAGVLGGIFLTAEFQTAMGMPNVNTISMIASVFLLASWLGCMIMASFGMILGRRQNIMIGNLVSAIGSIVSASSQSAGQMIASRVIIGIGNGLITSMVPVFVAEYAIDKNQRGRGVNSMIAMATVGTALAYWVDFGMVFTHGQVIWRFPVAFQITWSILSTAFIYNLPDTPRWYYAKGKMAEGDDILARLHSLPITDPAVDATKCEILASIELESLDTEGLRIKDFFWDTSASQAARRIRTGMCLFALAYLQGIDFLFYYMTSVFQVYIGLAPLTSSGLAGAATTVLVIANWTGVIYIEKMGRRTWLIGGAVLQSIFLAVFTGLQAHPGKETGAAAAAMIFLFIAVFGPGWAPFAYVYTSEIIPLRYRHIGFSLGVSCQWLFAWLTVYAGPIAAADPRVGWKVWIWFLTFNILSIPFVYFFCPETQGKSLEEIDLIFLKSDSSLLQSDAAKTLQHGGRDTSSGEMEEGMSASEKDAPKSADGSLKKETFTTTTDA